MAGCNEKQIFLTPDLCDPPKPWTPTHPPPPFWQASHPDRIQYKCLPNPAPSSPHIPAFWTFQADDPSRKDWPNVRGLLASFSFRRRLSMTSAETKRSLPNASRCTMNKNRITMTNIDATTEQSVLKLGLLYLGNTLSRDLAAMFYLQQNYFLLFNVPYDPSYGIQISL